MTMDHFLQKLEPFSISVRHSQGIRHWGGHSFNPPPCAAFLGLSRPVNTRNAFLWSPGGGFFASGLLLGGAGCQRPLEPWYSGQSKVEAPASKTSQFRHVFPTGEYICRYWHEGSLKEVRQVVNVPLVPTDIVQTLSQVSMNCSSPEKLTLKCCIQNRGRDLRASWNPGLPDPG